MTARKHHHYHHRHHPSVKLVSFPWLLLFVVVVILSNLVTLGSTLETVMAHLVVNASKEYYVEAETININCTLKSTHMAEDSRDLYLYHGSTNTSFMPWTTVHDRLRIDYPNPWTAAFYINNASVEDRGGYKCCGKDKSLNLCRVLRVWIAVILPPLKPTLDQCHVEEWNHVTCTWSPPGNIQKFRSYKVVQVLQASANRDFSENVSNSSVTPPGESQSIIRDAITRIHGNASLDEEICLRVLVEELEANFKNMSDAECYTLAQLVKTSQPLIEWTDEGLTWSLPETDYRDDVHILFHVRFHDNRNRENVSLITYETSTRLPWRPHTTYHVRVTSSYKIHGNDRYSTSDVVRYVPPSAPCRHPDTADNSFIVLQNSSVHQQPFQKLRFYFKPLQEFDWCSPNPPQYRVNVEDHCPSQVSMTTFQGYTLAYVDACVSMTTEEVQIVAFNQLGVSEDPSRRIVRVSRGASSEVSSWVEGMGVEALLSWKDAGSGSKGYTVFYCFAASLPATCMDTVEWLEVDSSTRELNLTQLVHPFNNYLFGVAVKEPAVKPGGNTYTGITWTDRYYSLYSDPEAPSVLTPEEVGDGKVRLLWKLLPWKTSWEKCLVIGYQVCQCPADDGTCTGNSTCFEVSSSTSSYQFDELNSDLTYIFWVRSRCRSGLSSYSVQKLRRNSGHVITIIIVTIVATLVAASFGFGFHFIKRLKKWHKKFSSGINIQTPKTPNVDFSKVTNQTSSFTPLDVIIPTHRPVRDQEDMNSQMVDSSHHQKDFTKNDSNFKRLDGLTTSSSALLNLKDQDDGSASEYCSIEGILNHDGESMAIESYDGRGDHGDDDDDDNGIAGVNREALMSYCKIQSGLRSSSVENDFEDNDYNEEFIRNSELTSRPTSQGSTECAPNVRNDENSAPVQDVNDYVTSEGLFDESTSFYPRDDCDDNCYDSGNITNGTDRVTDIYVEIKQSHKDRMGDKKGDSNFDNNNNDDDDDDEDDGNDGGDDINVDKFHAFGLSEVQRIDVQETNSNNPSNYTLFNNSDHHHHHHSNEDNKIITTFYSPLPTEEGELEGATSFKPDVSSTPYCALGTLLNDEMRCLLVSNDC